MPLLAQQGSVIFGTLWLQGQTGPDREQCMGRKRTVFYCAQGRPGSENLFLIYDGAMAKENRSSGQCRKQKGERKSLSQDQRDDNLPRDPRLAQVAYRPLAYNDKRGEPETAPGTCPSSVECGYRRTDESLTSHPDERLWACGVSMAGSRGGKDWLGSCASGQTRPSLKEYFPGRGGPLLGSADPSLGHRFVSRACGTEKKRSGSWPEADKTGRRGRKIRTSTLLAPVRQSIPPQLGNSRRVGKTCVLGDTSACAPSESVFRRPGGAAREPSHERPCPLPTLIPFFLPFHESHWAVG
ncbi:hypothetical protein VTK73DRAFT_4353 [Phialemonium thermophilum]|uniref:Uncharacterized protein n=1 Tax=Phialemonium thermophilum TaxID=223376 RepID=A0ABR3V9B6_9PEZI